MSERARSSSTQRKCPRAAAACRAVQLCVRLRAFTSMCVSGRSSSSMISGRLSQAAATSAVEPSSSVLLICNRAAQGRPAAMHRKRCSTRAVRPMCVYQMSSAHARGQEHRHGGGNVAGDERCGRWRGGAGCAPCAACVTPALHGVAAAVGSADVTGVPAAASGTGVAPAPPATAAIRNVPLPQELLRQQTAQERSAFAS